MNLLAPGWQCLIVQPPIYPGFTEKVSALTHFPLEPGCEDYSFWTKLSKTLSMVLILSSQDSMETPELDVSFDETDAISSLVSSGFTCLVTTHSDNLYYWLFLPSNLINYGAKLGYYFYLYHRWVQCHPLKLIHHFPVMQQHLFSNLLCHMITLLISHHSDFQTGIDAMAHGCFKCSISFSYHVCFC